MIRRISLPIWLSSSGKQANEMNEDVLKYMAKIGRKGGKVKSEAKTLACRENAKLPRKKGVTPA
jgi:hypothetical protein